MVTQRRLPRSSWLVLLLALVAAVMACHGVGAAVASHHDHGVAVHSASGIVSPPCHPTDDGQRADGDSLTCAAPGIGNGPPLSNQLTGVLQYADRAVAKAGSNVSTSADRGPPTLAELQRLRI